MTSLLSRSTLKHLVLAGLITAPMAWASSAMAEASGTLTVAVGAEPESLTPRTNACSYASNFATDSIYERLLYRNEDGSITGKLAESYERIDDLTWRFHLRQGVTFTNGEPFNADAITTAVEYYLDPDVASRCRGDFISLAEARKIDDYTVDMITKTPDATVPQSLWLRFFILPPKWLSETPDTETATTAVGTGPYKLVEWVKGDHVTLTANEDYWGEPKPTIKTIQLIPRVEGEVRAAMLRAGEADIAINLTPEQAEGAPRSAKEETTESVLIRLNTKHPVLQDIRVRQAIAHSIDVQTLIDALFPGVASPLEGHFIRPSALGWDPDLEDYEYDLAKAQALVKEAGATGEELDWAIRTDLLPNVMELAEAVQAMINQSGLVVNLVPVEAAPWRDMLYAREEGQERTDMLISSASNIQFDSSRVINNYFGLGPFSHADDEEFAAKMVEVSSLSGEKRVAGYQALWQEVHDKYWAIPLFGSDYLHGMSERVEWTPRSDGFIFWNTARLTD